jgi:very-short-patch-repair endonuclease
MKYFKIINEAKHTHGADLNIRSKAKSLRKNLTNQENKLWKMIKNRQLLGMHFRRQHPYGIYVLDFFCFEASLAIEVDGEIRISKGEYHNERTKYLESTGLKVIRFTNEDIEERIDSVILIISQYLNN